MRPTANASSDAIVIASRAVRLDIPHTRGTVDGRLSKYDEPPRSADERRSATMARRGGHDGTEYDHRDTKELPHAQRAEDESELRIGLPRKLEREPDHA